MRVLKDRLLLKTISGFCVIIIGLSACHGAIEKCQRIDDCSCEIPDGKTIDIRSLGYQGSKAPRFQFKQVEGEPWTYAYNPCYTFTYGLCKDVVACQKAADGTTSEVFGIGDATATWTIDNDKHMIEYSHTDSKQVKRTSQVTLVCKESQEEPTIERYGNKGGGTTYYFTLTSKCACPGVCQGQPTAPPHNQGGISPGSVLCIIVSVLVVVYVVGGMLFMKFVRHAEGREVIPNYSIWTNLFGYMRDGFVFVFTCGKKAGYDTMT